MLIPIFLKITNEKDKVERKEEPKKYRKNYKEDKRANNDT